MTCAFEDYILDAFQAHGVSEVNNLIILFHLVLKIKAHCMTTLRFIYL